MRFAAADGDEDIEILRLHYAQTIRAWRERFAPENEQDEWLVRDLVVQSVRLENCRVYEAVILDTSRVMNQLLSVDAEIFGEARVENLVSRAGVVPLKLTCSMRPAICALVHSLNLNSLKI